MSEGRISIIDGSPAEDESAWLDVVNAKLDGVGFHTAMYSQCLGGGLYDMAKIHKYRALEEYQELLCAVGEFVKLFGRPPRLAMSDPDVPSKIESNCQAIELYEEWETETFNELRSAKNKMKDKRFVAQLIDDVIDELRSVERMK